MPDERDDILTRLEEAGVDIRSIRVDENGLFHLPVKDIPSELPQLPVGYAFKGGAARYLLANSLGMEAIEPRDLDIIRLKSIESSDELDDAISRRYMPDDYVHGKGVEVVTDEVGYLNVHDFTINELYAMNGEIVATQACLEDALDGVLRLTEFEVERDVPKNKLLAKALRFKVESDLLGAEEFTLSEDLENRINGGYITPFFLALHLDRAWERGRDVAADYVDLLQEYGQVPDHVFTPEDAVDFLSDHIYDFEYRNAVEANNGVDPFESLEAHADLIDAAYEKYDRLDDAGRKGRGDKGPPTEHREQKDPWKHAVEVAREMKTAWQDSDVPELPDASPQNNAPSRGGGTIRR